MTINNHTRGTMTFCRPHCLTTKVRSNMADRNCHPRRPNVPLAAGRDTYSKARMQTLSITPVTYSMTYCVLCIGVLLTLFLPYSSCQGVTTEAPGPCAVVPCKNGASCEPSGDGASYTCSCAAGWTGQQCTEDIDECASSPCANGASCEQGQNYFICNCLPGYTGTLCDKDIDYCEATPCLNGGTCTDMVTGFTCSCPEGYMGDTCQTDVDDCLSSECMNNGSCVDGINMYTCDCGPYWTGDLCQEDIDECSLSPIPDCDTRSTCTNSQGGYSCTCPVGYSGDGATCQFIDLCEGNPCAHGVCLSHTLNFTCICDKGWTGPNCTEDINECNSVIGKCDAAYGDCVNTLGSFLCLCQPGSHGNGVKCIRDSVYPLGTNRICHNADSARSTYQIPGGFPYFGSLYYKVYTSIDGHVTFSPASLSPNPPYGNTPNFPPEPAVIAPFWTDLDTTSGPGALCVTRYEPSDGSDTFNDIDTDIRKYVGDVNLTYVIVFTYKEVEPYPSYVSASSKENATFQLVLATTNEQSFAMFNYNPDGPWLNMDANERRHLIGYSFGNGSAVKIDLLEDTPGFQTNIGHDGRYFFTLGDKMPSPDLSCLTWYRSQRSQGQRSLTPPCPCTLAQAGLDTRYEVNEETRCAETRFPDGSGGKQKCRYDSMGALHTGYPYGGYPMIPEDAEARAACCEVTELCHLFYELRPSDNCRTYKPPTWALAWGIGHYQTVNAEQFTFNDRGLFNLFDHSTFTLQGRTDLVPSLVTDLMATALVAVACKTPNSSTVEVSQGPGGGLVVMVDGVAAAPRFYSRVYLSEIGDDTVLVQFADGQAVLVTAVEDVLRVRLSVPEVHPGTKGLFTATPGGTQQQLSQYAAITDDVLFMDKNFSFPGYTPADLSATIEQLKNRVATNDSEPAAPCDQVVQCLYDYVATDGDISRGVSAITERTIYLEHRRKLANMAPLFNSALPPVLTVNQSVPIVMNVAAADPEGDHTIYNLSTNINTSDYIFLDSGYFRWVPVDTNTSIYIRFTATDKEGATTIYWPQVRLCDCAVKNIHSCDFGFIDILGSKSNDERYYKAECPCLPGYTGRTCSEVADLCDPNPCYTAPASNSCTTLPGVLPHGVSCAPCPEQLTGDGLRCFDENECMRGTSKCSHICVNQPGSYSCDCPNGYQLTDDKFICQDRDECTLGEHDCRGRGEYCSNTPGSYSCQCKGQYYRDNNTCVYAPFRSGGQVAYQALQLPSGETLTWSESLEQKDSDRYKTETTEVEKWCTGYYKHQPGFKDCQVTHYSKGSTIADYNLYMDQPLNISTAATDFRYYIEAQGCSMSGPACVVGPLVGVDPSRSYPKVKDLCEDDADNDCDAKSTQCSSYSNGTFSCSCQTGFKKYLDINTICQDIDECEGVNNCSVDTEDCVNTVGGFTCQCKDSYRTFNDKCVPACVPNPCKHNGECFPDVSATLRYTCRCKGFWSGPDCSTENRHARKLEKILIGIGVGLGLLCIILLIIIIITCIRCRSRGSHKDTSDTETFSDKKLNDSFDIESKISHSVWVDRLFSSALSLHDDEQDDLTEKPPPTLDTFRKPARNGNKPHT